MNGGLLQFFLLLNAFFVGVGSVYAFRHARAHFRPDSHDAEKPAAAPPVKLPPAVREQLLAEAQKRYQKILDDAASELQLDLAKTTATLNKQLAGLAGEIVGDEMKRYRASLDELQNHTEAAIATTKQELGKHKEDLQAVMADHQKELVATMNEQVEAEKQQLIAQIDGKLADAAASFLIEALGHDVDLGSQTDYLVAQLEAHKDEFKKEVM